MFWRSGITLREPAFPASPGTTQLRDYVPLSSRNLPCLGFSLFVSYGGWALSVTDYNPAMALFCNALTE
jgi:hypothetical protein